MHCMSHDCKGVHNHLRNITIDRNSYIPYTVCTVLCCDVQTVPDLCGRRRLRLCALSVCDTCVRICAHVCVRVCAYLRTTEIPVLVHVACACGLCIWHGRAWAWCAWCVYPTSEDHAAYIYSMEIQT